MVTTFNLVDWRSIATILKGKPEMFGLWLSKQSIGVRATRKNLARIQDILDHWCPNYDLVHKNHKHLNWCPDLTNDGDTLGDGGSKVYLTK